MKRMTKAELKKKSKHITIISKFSRCYIHEIINNSYLFNNKIDDDYKTFTRRFERVAKGLCVTRDKG